MHPPRLSLVSPRSLPRPRFAHCVLLLAAALLLALTPAAMANDSLEEVLANYYEAVGGKDAWSKIEAFRQTGSMNMMGMDAPFTVVAAEPNKLRVEFEFQGMTGTQAYDGESGWQIMPFMGSDKPEPMPEDMAKTIGAGAGVSGPLFDYEEKGHSVELVGKAEVEGTDAYELKITLASGQEMTWYLDAEYYVPIQSKMSMSMQGQTFESVTTLSDYKEVAGVMMPHSTVQSSPMGAQTVTIAEIEVNPDLPADFFTMPAADGADGE